MERSNHLANETSPYLLQHAHNPVEWYPWGDEALEKARREDKPILLSVGYAACHWCHVMAHESFENESIAAVMNAHFVNIKVDREERPDIDQLYMTFVQMTTGSGGWPMTVFLTPEQKPFFGGTYFPPEARYGRPGFPTILRAVSRYYTNEKDKLDEAIDQVENALNVEISRDTDMRLPDIKDFDTAIDKLSMMYEPQFGGVGHAPKFPAVKVFELFLRYYHQCEHQNWLDMVEHTLRSMANGGIYDQLGGGFARYSVDEEWLVPHFEKMLYDNAQLVPLYLDTYLVTNDRFYLNIACETLDFVLREMTSPEGGFYSSLDADSEGEEGKFYVWSKEEVIETLGKETAEIFCRRYDVSSVGNFEGRNILHVHTGLDDLAKMFNSEKGEIKNLLEAARRKLLQKRASRVRPGLDDKVLTSWNGLMISAFCRGYQVTKEERYEKVLRASIAFIRKNLLREGRLLRSWRDGKAKQPAFAEDYAFLSAGLIDAYQTLFEDDYLDLAILLTDHANAHFADPHDGICFTSSDEQKDIYKRVKDTYDQSIPATSGVHLMNNLHLYFFTEKKGYLQSAEKTLASVGPLMDRNTYGFASYLNALDFYLQKPVEILIVAGEKNTRGDLYDTVVKKYLPNRVIIVKKDSEDATAISADWLKGKKAVDGKPTAWVCHNFTCSLPVTAAKDLDALFRLRQID